MKQNIKQQIADIIQNDEDAYWCDELNVRKHFEDFDQPFRMNTEYLWRIDVELNKDNSIRNVFFVTYPPNKLNELFEDATNIDSLSTYKQKKLLNFLQNI